MALGLLVASGSGCGDAAVFVCQTDADCIGGGPSGVCQPTNYCSFPDPTCDSGQRYGELAESNLANACVDSGIGTGTDGPASETDEPRPTTVSTTATSTSTTATSMLDDTGPVDSSTTAPPVEDTGTTSDGPKCLYDEFDDGSFDGYWCPVQDAGLALREEDGLLWGDLDPTRWGSGSAHSWLEACEPFVLDGASVEVRVAAVPNAMPNATTALEFGNDDGRLIISASASTTYVLTSNGSSYQGVLNDSNDNTPPPYDWRIRGTAEGLTLERAIGNGGWRELHSMPLDTSALGNVRIGVYASGPPASPDSGAYEYAQICLPD